MKKFLLVLMVVALASFLLTGCFGVPDGTEGEGEGEGETEFVTIAVDGAVLVDGVKYVAGGTHDIIVTFAAPVAGWVDLTLEDCVGDYSKASSKEQGYVLFPNADRTVFTGSAFFGCCDGEDGGDPCDPGCTDCCATLITVAVGECEDCYYSDAVIVDSAPPYAALEVCASACECAGCAISFTSMVTPSDCDPDEGLCGDDCSGIAGWSIAVYDGFPFEGLCCEVPCDEPIYTCTGVDPFCPIECVTDCLDECDSEGMMELYVILTMWDKVGNEMEEGAFILVDCDSCEVVDTYLYTEWADPENPCVDDLTLQICEGPCIPCE